MFKDVFENIVDTSKFKDLATPAQNKYCMFVTNDGGNLTKIYDCCGVM